VRLARSDVVADCGGFDDFAGLEKIGWQGGLSGEAGGKRRVCASLGAK